jgi:hypothetical protein
MHATGGRQQQRLLEDLGRIVVPVTTTEADAAALGARVAESLVPAVFAAALPTAHHSFRNRRAVHTRPDLARRIAGHDDVGLDVLAAHHRAGRHDDAVAEVGTRHDEALGPNPDTVPDDHLLVLVTLLADRLVGPRDDVVDGPDLDAGAEHHVVANLDAAGRLDDVFEADRAVVPDRQVLNANKPNAGGDSQAAASPLEEAPQNLHPQRESKSSRHVSNQPLCQEVPALPAPQVTPQS